MLVQPQLEVHSHHGEITTRRGKGQIKRRLVLGLWSFTNLEYAYAVLRVDERRRVFAVASLANVTLTIAAVVTLVVGFGLEHLLRKEGLLIIADR